MPTAHPIPGSAPRLNGLGNGWSILGISLGLGFLTACGGGGWSQPATSGSVALGVAPSITTPPTAQSVTAGDPVTFTVVATGTAPLSYQWNLNNVAISGATADYYSIASVQSANAGNYTVTVSNGTLPNATSTAVALTVNPVVVAPTISTYPASKSVVAGNSASFSVVATGSAPLSYQWHLDNVNDGSNSASYTSSSSLATGSYPVTVTVSNGAGSVTSNVATLAVTTAPVAPSISTPPSAQSVTAGDPVTFTVVATGTAPLSYQWNLNNVAISGATADYYSIASVQSANAGNYTVTVSNGTLPNATSTAVALTVNPVVVAPTISTYPASKSVVAGNSASFSVVATGSAPLSYQWHLDNVNDGSNSASYQSPSTTTIGSHTVTVTVSNAAGSVLSNPALLTVTALPVAPSITTQPSAQVVTVGNPVTFTVVATGTAPLSYQWYSGTSSTTVTTPISGANSDFYAPSTALAGTIYFAVAVSNGIGMPATSNAVALTVNAAPVAPTTIAINGSSTPSVTEVTEGQSITFTATATGSTPYTYQWQQNGTSVGSNASTFTLALPRLTDSGSSIKVTVTNAAGSVTSSAVTLTVNPLLVNLDLGGSMPLNLTPIPAGTFTMGSPPSDPDNYQNAEAQHQVTISQNFYMGTYLVTQAQWVQVMRSNPSYFQTGGGSTTNDLQRPVEQVSWNDIATSTKSPKYTCFLDWLNDNMATICPLCPTNYVFRLPTEAEWEYACRAGTTTRFYWGDYSDANTTINDYAWYWLNDGTTTKPVGGLLPNDWGLYDMAGNVWEWCQDWYAAYDSGTDPDPAGSTTGSYRVSRGGGWADLSSGCRSACRGSGLPGFRGSFIGFRVVLAPPRRTP